MRYSAHTTNAANEQQSRSPFGLMIRLLLVLLLLLFHAGAMAGGGNPPSISLAGILSAYTEGDGTKTPASDVTITVGDSGSPNSLRRKFKAHPSSSMLAISLRKMYSRSPTQTASLDRGIAAQPYSHLLHQVREPFYRHLGTSPGERDLSEHQ